MNSDSWVSHKLKLFHQKSTKFVTFAYPCDAVGYEIFNVQIQQCIYNNKNEYNDLNPN